VSRRLKASRYLGVHVMRGTAPSPPLPPLPALVVQVQQLEGGADGPAASRCTPTPAPRWRCAACARSCLRVMESCSPETRQWGAVGSTSTHLRGSQEPGWEAEGDRLTTKHPLQGSTERPQQEHNTRGLRLAGHWHGKHGVGAVVPVHHCRCRPRSGSK